MKKDKRPVLGITMGDVAGVGPEVLVRSLAEDDITEICRPLVLGDPGAARAAIDRLGLDLKIELLEHGCKPEGKAHALEILPLSGLNENELVPGDPTPGGGLAAARYIETGAEMALSGFSHGVVTAPISKEALNQAGYRFPGHTELLAHKAGGCEVVMMLAGSKLRVVLVTIHEALKDVPGLVTAEKIIKTAEITNRSMERFFGFKPKMAVCALNPHAGEHGLFGDEDDIITAPAVEEARVKGMDIHGPFPADTLFYRAVSGEFDIVVCMYHDQGLIPLKLIHFKDGVNVTLGLPFIRTSVDHGTAYNLAGTGRADHSSMTAAIRMASEMARRSGLVV